MDGKYDEYFCNVDRYGRFEVELVERYPDVIEVVNSTNIELSEDKRISEEKELLQYGPVKVRELCETFGITHIMKKYPAEISGGERQRAAVARALINQPLLVLADEPTGNLDSKSGCSVIDSFLLAKKKLHSTIFMVTHDSFAASFSDRVILLKDGRIQHVLLNHGDQATFRDQLLEGIRSMDQIIE